MSKKLRTILPRCCGTHLYVGLLSTNAQPNEGCNEIGLTMQSAGPVREPWQPIELEFQFKVANLDIGKSKEDATH